jgi:hypothetical protein
MDDNDQRAVPVGMERGKDVVVDDSLKEDGSCVSYPRAAASSER